MYLFKMLMFISYFDREKFVEFHDLRAAETAQEALNDMDFNGVKLEVQFANTQSKTMSVGGVEEKRYRCGNERMCHWWSTNLRISIAICWC